MGACSSAEGGAVVSMLGFVGEARVPLWDGAGLSLPLLSVLVLSNAGTRIGGNKTVCGGRLRRSRSGIKVAELIRRLPSLL